MGDAGGGRYVEFSDVCRAIAEVWIPDHPADWIPFHIGHIAPFLGAYAEMAIAGQLDRIGNCLIAFARHGEGQHVNRDCRRSQIDLNHDRVADEEGHGGTVLVASGDRDAFQLASDRTTILQPVRAGEIARIGPAEVRGRYGVQPGQVPDFIALRGDPSDKLPGARGVGPKGAAKLLRLHGTLEGALIAGRLAAQADDLRLYRRIATMDAAAPLPPLPDQTPTWTSAADLARAWELNRLAERLAALAQSAQ